MLKIMHRGYKSDRYRRKIEVFREAVPEGSLSTDIIVGTRGDEEDHEETLRLIGDCGFDAAYVFKFSPRRGRRPRSSPARCPTRWRSGVFLEVLRAIEGNALTTQPRQDRVGRGDLRAARSYRRRHRHRRDVERARRPRPHGRRSGPLRYRA
jgi:tRNA-2-methylthio-N6-dimethylallyladenosine synthase